MQRQKKNCPYFQLRVISISYLRLSNKNQFTFRYKSKEIINTDDDLSTDSDEEKPLKPKLVNLKSLNLTTKFFNNDCRKNLDVK